MVRAAAAAAGADGAHANEVWARGGEGGTALAEEVAAACEKPTACRFLYPPEASIKTKIEILAEEVYGADRVNFFPEAERKIELYTQLGYAQLPINMAKTHLSLSHDPNLKGVPKGFALPIRDLRISRGAGFIYPLCGEMRTMPGLPSKPAFMRVDLDDEGEVVGLS
jgi:formyltetrahydrofolate synthetase